MNDHDIAERLVTVAKELVAEDEGFQSPLLKKVVRQYKIHNAWVDEEADKFFKVSEAYYKSHSNRLILPGKTVSGRDVAKFARHMEEWAKAREYAKSAKEFFEWAQGQWRKGEMGEAIGQAAASGYTNANDTFSHDEDHPDFWRVAIESTVESARGNYYEEKFERKLLKILDKAF